MTTYIGPYLTVPSTFEWWKFDNIFTDARTQAGNDMDIIVLVPNQELNGVERPMRIGDGFSQATHQISPADIVKETAAFSRVAEPIFKYCNDYNIEIHEGWGVVPFLN